MPNTHLIADTMAEIMAREEDLLPACVISTTWPTVPVSSMTLAAFTTQAYVRDGQHLVYCDQPAITLTLSGSDGTYWLAISRDVQAAYATWTRRAGSHYLWSLSGARPPDVDGLMVFCSVTVAGGIITAVTPASGVTRAERWRTLAALGTMAQQDASAVAITGGTLANVQITTPLGIQRASDPSYSLVTLGAIFAGGTVQGQSNLDLLGTANIGGNLSVTGSGTVAGALTVERAALGVSDPAVRLGVGVARATYDGLTFRPDADAGAKVPVRFYNAAGTQVGYIDTNATTTTYATTSDARLKTAVEPLTGALAVVRRLRPQTGLWRADGSPWYGFLAHEVQQELPDAGIVTGQPDAVDDGGNILPQMMDPSKLVVWLVGACQELAAQVEALTARLEAAGA